MPSRTQIPFHVTHHHLKGEIHPDNPPEVWNMTYGSNQKILWRRECQPGVFHQWRAVVASRTKQGTGCPDTNCRTRRTRKTCKKTYGVEHPMKCSEIQQKVENTTLKRHGVHFPLQSKRIQKNTRATFKKRYGVEFALQVDKFSKKAKRTTRSRFGVDNAMQDPKIASKNIRHALRKKEYVFPSGRTEYVQGFEPFALDELIWQEDVDEDDIVVNPAEMPEIWWRDEKSNRHRYFPDILVTSTHLLIEVKSEWTITLEPDMIERKKQAALKAGFNYEFRIYSKKGHRISTWNNTVDEIL